MIKKDKSLVALSLGIAITSQNMMFVSAANKNGDAIILSDDEFKIKINSDNLTENKATFSEHQTVLEDSKTYSMDSDISKAFNLGNSISANKNLINPRAIGSGQITSANLNVRSGPSTSSSIIGTLNSNQTVEILGKSSNWYKIDYNGKEGYISSSYIKLNVLEHGIDVSKWNGTINWNNVKNSGVDYVIIRAGHGTSTVDPQFKNYIEGAKKAGLDIGVYWFSYATSVEKAKAEANSCIQALAPYKNSINYPVFFDFEYDSVKYAKKQGITVTKDLASQMATAFLSNIRAAGYTTGLYTNKDFSRSYYNNDLLYSHNLWIAQYGLSNSFDIPYSIWQYSENGRVPGIGGAVDLNYTLLKDFGINFVPDTDISIPSTPSEKGTIVEDVYLRKDASTSSSILEIIPKDASVEVLDKLPSGWFKIKYDNKIGYVYSSYIILSDDIGTNGDTSKPSTPSEKGIITDNVNFRKDSSTSSSILGVIPKDTTVEVLDKLSSSWFKVKYNNKIGYVYSQYIQLSSNSGNNSDTSKPSTSSEKGIVTDNVNFRKNSSTSSSILGVIPKGTTVEVLDKLSSGWFKVKYKNNIGYVSSTYIKLNSNSNSRSLSLKSKKEGVTTANLNFRKSTSTSSLVINTIPRNTTIEILDQLSSGWYKVKYKGTTGYVSGNYINIKK
ncbi:SH3 domain-containing protein [Terrisporobacter sp.]